MARSISQADGQVIAAAAAVDVHLTARQLERWRQAGWIEPPERRFLGRGRGSTSTYPPEAIAQAVALAQAVRRRYPLHMAVLDLFATHEPVSEAAFKRALHEFLSTIEPRLRELAGASPGDDTFDVAEGAALELANHADRQKLLRQWRRRARGQPESAQSIMQSALTNLLLLVLGSGAASRAGVGELLGVSGVAGTWSDRSGAVRPIVPTSHPTELDRVLRALNIESLAAITEQVTMAALLQARDDWEMSWEFGWLAGYVHRETTGLPDALGFGALRGVQPSAALVAVGTLGMIVLGGSAGGQLEAYLDRCRCELRRYRAMAVILPDVPVDARPYMADGGLARLLTEDEAVQRHVMTAIREAAERHPVEAAFLSG